MSMSIWQGILSVQKRVATVKRDAKNPHFRNNYASLEAVWGVIREPLAEAGIACVQLPGGLSDGVLSLTTKLVHAESGETLENTMQVPVPKLDPQGIGSALTYAQRYALMAILGIAPSDDDGEAARHDNTREVRKTAPDGTPVPTLDEAMKECGESVQAIKKALEDGDNGYALQCWDEVTAAQKMALWVAPSKGGPFTTAERAAIKKLRDHEQA